MTMFGSDPIRLTNNANSFSPAGLHVTQNSAIPHPDCTSGWTRLTAGSQAKVSEASTTPHRVRSAPSRVADVIAQLHPGTVVNVLDGPVCAEGLVFWKVESDLISGGVSWTAEGDGAEYYLEPSDRSRQRKR